MSNCPRANFFGWEIPGLSDCEVFGTNYVECIDNYGNFAYTFYDLIPGVNMPSGGEWYQYCYDYHHGDDGGMNQEEMELYEKLQDNFDPIGSIGRDAKKYLPIILIGLALIWVI